MNEPAQISSTEGGPIVGIPVGEVGRVLLDGRGFYAVARDVNDGETLVLRGSARELQEVADAVADSATVDATTPGRTTLSLNRSAVFVGEEVAPTALPCGCCQVRSFRGRVSKAKVNIISPQEA